MSTNGDTSVWTLQRIGALCSILGSAIGLGSLLSGVGWLLGLVRLTSVVVLCTAGGALTAVLFALAGWRVRRRGRQHRLLLTYAHRDQGKATIESPYYHETIRADARRLRVSPAGLAKAADIPLVVARYFLDNPETVPRPDLLGRFETAFLLPNSYFRRGGPYGDQMTLARLLKYREFGICVWSLSKIQHSSRRERGAMLFRIQRQLDAEESSVRREGKDWG